MQTVSLSDVNHLDLCDYGDVLLFACAVNTCLPPIDAHENHGHTDDGVHIEVHLPELEHELEPDVEYQNNPGTTVA